MKKGNDCFIKKQSVETPVEQARNKLSVAKNQSMSTKQKRVKLQSAIPESREAKGSEQQRLAKG